jgi:hypothetical protein
MSALSELPERLTTEQVVRALLQIGGLTPDQDEIRQFVLLYQDLRIAADRLYRSSSSETSSNSLDRLAEGPKNDSWWQ